MKKILVVDDSASIRLAVRGILEKNGFSVFEAIDGKNACSLYGEINPDLVIMDIVMPEMNGIEALKNIMAQNSKANVIMLSSLFQKNIVLDALKIGAKDYVVKPVVEANLLFVLKEIFADKSNNQLNTNTYELIKDTHTFDIFIESNNFSVVFNNGFNIKSIPTLKNTLKSVFVLKNIDVEFDFKDISLDNETLNELSDIIKKIRENGMNCSLSSENEKLKNQIKDLNL